MLNNVELNKEDHLDQAKTFVFSSVLDFDWLTLSQLNCQVNADR